MRNTKQMNYKVLLGIGFGVAIFFTFRFFVKKEDAYIEELKRYPTKYSYVAQDSVLLFSLSSNDKECMKRIKEYYESRKHSRSIPVPACPQHVIKYENPVHVIRYEEDSINVFVAVFYQNHSGREAYFTGYILRSALHDYPYTNK